MEERDQGQTWTRISNGLPIASINPFTGDTLYTYVWSIAKVKQSKTFYAAVLDSGIYKSYDAGKNWFSVNNELTHGLTFRGGIVVSEIDTNAVYVGNWGDALVNIPGGVLSSVDSGKNWNRTNAGLPNLPLNRISAFHLTIDNLSNTLYGTFGFLYPTSEGYALYKFSPATTTTVDEPKHNFVRDYHLFQNHPNPFNSGTAIRYHIKNRAVVELKIYDVTGREVIELVSTSQASGEYHINWNGKYDNGGDAPSGMYLIQLKAGSFIQFRKMLLIR